MLAVHRVYSAPTDRATGIICDQTIALDGHYTSQHYPEHLRIALGKIFSDLIERVRFARTLSWREVDSNFRFPAMVNLFVVRFVPRGCSGW
jgi:hypothetical protein